MVPYYIFAKDERQLRMINDLVSRILYMPIALALTVIFTTLSLILVPFAYLSALKTKLKMLCKREERGDVKGIDEV